MKTKNVLPHYKTRLKEMAAHYELINSEYEEYGPAGADEPLDHLIGHLRCMLIEAESLAASFREIREDDRPDTKREPLEMADLKRAIENRKDTPWAAAPGLA